ncbi:uncharacterized protein GJ701_016322 isoform 1-T1 [Geothlypis trichas]
MPGAAVASDHPLGLATRACTKRRQRELFASRYRPRRPLGPAGTPTNIRLAAGTHLLRQRYRQGPLRGPQFPGQTNHSHSPSGAPRLLWRPRKWREGEKGVGRRPCRLLGELRGRRGQWVSWSSSSDQ